MDGAKQLKDGAVRLRLTFQCEPGQVEYSLFSGVRAVPFDPSGPWTVLASLSGACTGKVQRVRLTTSPVPGAGSLPSTSAQGYSVEAVLENPAYLSSDEVIATYRVVVRSL